jgi:hypothetical protein
MGGAILPLAHIPLRHLQGQLYPSYTVILCRHLFPHSFYSVLFVTSVVDFLGYLCSQVVTVINALFFWLNLHFIWCLNVLFHSCLSHI